MAHWQFSPAGTPTVLQRSYPGTPSILRGGVAPWAQQTPSCSPSPKHRHPSFFLELDGSLSPGSLSQASSRENDFDFADRCGDSMAATQASPPVAGVITKEFLRNACAPFFEQMLEEIERRVRKQLNASMRCTHCGAPFGGLPDAEAVQSHATTVARQVTFLAHAKDDDASPQSSTSSGQEYGPGDSNSTVAWGGSGLYTFALDGTFALDAIEAYTPLKVAVPGCPDAVHADCSSTDSGVSSDSPASVEVVGAATQNAPGVESVCFESIFCLGTGTVGDDAAICDAEVSSRPVDVSLTIALPPMSAPCVPDAAGADQSANATEGFVKVLLGTERKSSKLTRITERQQERAAAKGLLNVSRGGKQGCTMVCHHWKSKGWCRLGTDCKFLHSEEKRGVTFSQRNPRGCLSGGRPHARSAARKGFHGGGQSAVDATCSPPANFVTFSPGGYFSAVPMPAMPSQLPPLQCSPEGYFFLTPGF